MTHHSKIRVRIAPSPTGALHIGTARTALFNYLFAKQKGGDFILRIEDTDKQRSQKKWEKDIIDSLKWLGIEWDEGPVRQSERIEIYKKYIRKLLEQGKIYHCFCTKKELDQQRKEQRDRGEAPRYTGKCRSLTPQQVQEKLKTGASYVLRLKTPKKTVVFNDLIRGKIEMDSSLLGDFAVAKGVETPLYNLACIIDDAEMGISHVIRGEDHISNTFKQILLGQAIGISKFPEYAHLPLILAPDKSKLSKRYGAVSIIDFREQGYLKEALVNFMALLGWSPGNDKEVLSLAELKKEFSLKRVQKSGAVFNQEKLDWLNGFYIRQKPLPKITKLCVPYLVKAGLLTPLWGQESTIPGYLSYPFEVIDYRIGERGEKISFKDLKRIVGLYQDRLKKLSEITGLIDFFFKEKLNYEKELLRWKEMDDKELAIVLDKLQDVLSNIKERDWTQENLKQILLPLSEKIGDGDRGKMLWPFRVALCGKKASAGPFEIAEVLGKQKTLQRVQQAIQMNSL